MNGWLKAAYLIGMLLFALAEGGQVHWNFFLSFLKKNHLPIVFTSNHRR